MPSIRRDVTLLVCATLAALPASGEAPAETPPTATGTPSITARSLRAEASWRGLGDLYWEGAAWTARGEALRGETPAEAVPAFEEALRCWRAAGAAREEADALVAIGTLLNNLSRNRDALGRFEEARALARDLSAPDLEARALNGVGESRAQMFEAEAAFDAFTELLALCRRTGDAAGEIEALGNLGYVYLQLGDYLEAARLFERALEPARRHGQRSFEATLLNNLGETLARGGDLEAARPHFEEALALRPEGAPQRAYAMVNLGSVYRQTGDARRAIGLFEGALASFRAAGNRWGEAVALDQLGWASLSLGEPDRAYAFHMQALPLHETLNDPLYLVPSLYGAAQAELKRGRPDQALALSERAYTTIEAGRDRVLSRRLRTTLLAPWRLIYEGHVDALMAVHRARSDTALVERAFEVGERARARSLLELLADASGPGGDGPPQDMAQPLTMAELRARALDDDTVVVAYLLGDDRGHVWALSRDTVVAHELPPRAQIAGLARRAQELLAARPGRGQPESAAAEAQDVLAELGRVLLSPVAPQLGTRRVAIVADGPLHHVPFAALPDPAHPGVPLMVEHEVVSLPSVSTLALLREAASRRAPPSRTVAVFADPVFDAGDERVRPGRRQPAASTEPTPRRSLHLTSSVRDVDGDSQSGLGRLPFTRREALDILELAGKGGARRALDFDANLAAVRAPDLADFRFVHFATHGLLNNARPEASGLVLSLADREGRARDGFLSVEEILKLRWRADLVTLSGCRTGLGRSVSGEGVVGLTRAFMVAGVPRVVASLWSVDDSATAELMKRFYGEMLGPARRTPAAALRAAQLEMRKTRAWSAPYYWAAFQLQGDWR